MYYIHRFSLVKDMICDHETYNIIESIRKDGNNKMKIINTRLQPQSSFKINAVLFVPSSVLTKERLIPVSETAKSAFAPTLVSAWTTENLSKQRLQYKLLIAIPIVDAS